MQNEYTLHMFNIKWSRVSSLNNKKNKATKKNTSLTRMDSSYQTSLCFNVLNFVYLFRLRMCAHCIGNSKEEGAHIAHAHAHEAHSNFRLI